MRKIKRSQPCEMEIKKKTLKICSLVKVIILQPDDTCYFSFEIYCSYLFLFFVFFHYYCVIGVHFGDLNLQ